MRSWPRGARWIMLSLALHLGVVALGWAWYLSRKGREESPSPRGFTRVEVTGGAQSKRAGSALAVSGRAESGAADARPEGRTEEPADFGSGADGSTGEKSDGGGASRSGGSGPAADEYRQRVRAKVESRLQYPVSLQRRGIRGRAVVSLVIRRDGHLALASITESSGHAELDELALAAVRASEPFQEFDAAMGSGSELSLILPMEFKLPQ